MYMGTHTYMCIFMCMHAYVQMYAVSQIQSVTLIFQHVLGVKNTECPKNTVGKCHHS